MEPELEFDNHIIVFCGGKCGSSTLYKTFLNNGYNSIHIHSFNNFLNTHKNICEKHNIKSMLDFISKQRNNNIIVIDSYRTPIERHISGFFQNIIHCIKMPINEMINKLDIRLLIYWFNKFHIDFENYHPLDHEIPIFSDTYFDFEKKYIKKELVLCNKNIQFIKIRFNEINNWKCILSEILNKDIIIHDDNKTIDKHYYVLYKNFLKNYLVPESYLTNITNTNIFNRYNSENEKNEYLKYWNNKKCDNFYNNMNDFEFVNIDKNFNVDEYKKNVNVKYDCDIDYIIHYELIGFYK
jgi:hypothetical protein